MHPLIPSHGNPQNKVYGVIGSSARTDEGSVYAKTSDDKLNVGWENVLPTRTPSSTPVATQTPTPTRTTTPVPVVSPSLTSSPGTSATPTPTSTVGATPTPTPSFTPTPTPTISVTPAPTSTPAPSGGVPSVRNWINDIESGPVSIVRNSNNSYKVEVFDATATLTQITMSLMGPSPKVWTYQAGIDFSPSATIVTKIENWLISSAGSYTLVSQATNTAGTNFASSIGITVTFTPQLSVNGGQPGIASTFGSGTYPAGTHVDVGATLSPGYSFDHWSDDTGYLLTGSFPNQPNPNSVLMPNADVVLTPIATNAWTLSTSTSIASFGPLGESPGGTGPTGGGSYSNGTVVNVSMTPDANTQGVLVIDGAPRAPVDGTNSDSVNITMSSNRTAQAIWYWKNVNWTTTRAGGGAGTPTGPGGATSGTAKKTQTINISANISSGTFTGWTCPQGGVVFGNASLQNTTATINSDGNHTLTANVNNAQFFVNGQYSVDGVLEFEFAYSGGTDTYLSYGYPGQFVTNILCASAILTIYQGNAYLNGTSCG